MRNFLLRLLILIVFIVMIPIAFIWIPIALLILSIFCPLYWLFTGKDFSDIFIFWISPFYFTADIIMKIEKLYK